MKVFRAGLVVAALILASVKALALEYRVQSGDTLSQIAERLSSQGGEPAATLMARLFDSNPSAFLGDDINKLKVGYVLRLETSGNDARVSPPSENIGAAPKLSDAAAKQNISSALRRVRPDLPISKLERSESPDLFEIEYAGGNTLYATADGKYLLVGELYEVTGNQLVNLTERKKNGMRAELISAIPSSDMISFAPQGDAKAEIFVFTDVDCGYCRKLHDEIQQITDLGIKVNYLAYPRAGARSEVAQRMQSAWCSNDPQQAMTSLKGGSGIEVATCPSDAVAQQFALGQQLGVTGTPTLFLADGTKMVGYRPAAELAKILIP